MNRGMTKAERLREMERLYIQRQGGFTDAELAERFGVTRSTIYRDRIELEREIIFKEVAPGRWAIDRTKYLSSIRVDLTEALALYLAARRMSRHTRTHQAHVVSALEKLAAALKQPMTEHLVKTAASIAGQDPQPERLTIMETIVRGWADQIKVRITHKALWAKRSMTYTISPYLIEPSLWSDGTYVIGYSDVHNGLATFKIERIERAVLTTERFTPADDFDEQELLKFAWGIWYSDKDPVTIRLKFTGRKAVTRLKESIWHPMQEPLIDTDDGGCIWEAQVAELQEMVPWIRGWGADVEVLEPEELREALVRETKRLALLYRVGNVEPLPLYRRLWGKVDRRTYQTHPLICHMLDVAYMALELWNQVLTTGIRKQMADVLGLDIEAAGRVLAFWIALHDLGKASPAFQNKSRLSARLRELLKAKLPELPFPKQVGEQSCHHGAITAYTLPPLLTQETGLDETWAYNVAVAIGGHHGDWPTSVDFERYATEDERGDVKWDAVRKTLFDKLGAIFNPSTITPPSLTTEMTNAFFTLFSGLTTIADWLGSMEEYFPLVEDDIDLARYIQQAPQRARDALHKTGWLGWQSPSTALDFETLFDVQEARPLQKAIVKLAPQLDKPALVIIEAPTGVGKTEAALYLADHWAHAQRQRGAYIAMPTMATSNQMFDRVGRVLERRYDESIVNYHLLHGGALLRDNDELPRLARIEDDTPTGTVAALEWFTQRKRGLLAPFAVGTVDQALLSILQTRHFFVRLFGLSHKTVVFDEVHAYDTYMEELFFLLLRWLRVVGTSVVILSATLPEITRRKLVEAYVGIENAQLPETPYPAVTWTTGDHPQVLKLARPEPRSIQIEPVSREPDEIVDRLGRELDGGRCAAVICNTVGRAQKVYQAIKQARIVPDDDLILFHARFPAEWRKDIEETVTMRYGKQKDPTLRRGIVVATQVIEQSLDLDFDLMISDLAPVDLIIQRIGRLHRHDRGIRPTPRLLLAMPELDADDVPHFTRGDAWVYGRYHLLRSYAVLHGRNCITVPDDVQLLIEAVYSPEEQIVESFSSTFIVALDKARKIMENKMADAQWEADGKLILEPTHWKLLHQANAQLEEDNPELHKYQQAATRLAPPSITLICLHQTPHGLTLDPEPGSLVVKKEQKPDPDTTRLLFARKISVSDPRLVNYFAEQPVPSAWTDNPWLRRTRLVEFEKGGVYTPKDENWTLKLDRKLGLFVNAGSNPHYDECAPAND